MDGLRVLREIKLLGQDRKFGDVISKDDVEKIPGPTLRAMVDMRTVELLGEEPGKDSRLTALEQKVDHLSARVDAIAETVMPPEPKKRRTTKRGGK